MNNSIEVIHPIENEPVRMLIIPSGWTSGHDLYHFIIEFGEFDHTEYNLYTRKQIDQEIARFVSEYKTSKLSHS